MAELDPIEKKLVLTIEEHLAGAMKAAGELRSVKESAEKAAKGLDKYSKSAEKSTKAIDRSTKSWMHMVGATKILTTSLRRVALGFGLLAVGLTKLWSGLVQNQQAFLDLAMASVNSTNVVSRLMSSVDKATSSFDKASISYLDAAEALAAFKSESYGTAVALESIAGLSDQLTEVFQTISARKGEDTAKSLLSELQNFGLAGSQIQKITSLAMENTDEARAKLIGFIKGISSTDLTDWAKRFGKAVQVIGEDESQTKGILSWKKFWTELNALYENFGTKLFKQLSDKVATMFDKIESYFPQIISSVGTAIDWITSHFDELVTVFNMVIDTIVWAVKSFSELGKTMKYVVGIAAGLSGALLFLPGLAPMLFGAGKAAWYLGTHLGGILGGIGLAGGAFLRFGKTLAGVGWLGAVRGATLLGTAAKLMLSPIGIIIIATTAALKQFYTWFSKGPEFTWGGKITDWLFDYEKKIDKIQKKNVRYKSSWFGFGTKEVSEQDWMKEDYDRKKESGKLRTDEQTFDDYYKEQKRRDREVAEAQKKRDSLKSSAAKNADEAAKKAIEAAKAEEKAIAAVADAAAKKLKGIEEYNVAMANALSLVGPDESSQAQAKLGMAGQQWKALQPGIESATQGAEQLSKIIDTLGPSPATNRAVDEHLALVEAMVPMWRQAADDAVAAAKAQLAVATDASERQSSAKVYTDELAKQAKLNEAIATQIHLRIKASEKMASLEGMRVQAAKTGLEITKATYGAAGLSVKAQWNVVESLQAQKEYLKKAHTDTLKQIELEKQRDGRVSQTALEQELRLRNEILGIESEQVNMLKELRDGYLSAVNAQALGAGKFEKIIITQEKNLRIGLDKRMVKYNFLLGAVGEAAKRSNVPIVRFSSGEYGLEKIGGGMMTDEDIKKHQEEIQINMTDNVSRGAAAAATQLIFEIMGNVDGGLRQIGKSVGLFDNVINKANIAQKRYGAFIGETPSSSVVFGEAQRSGKIPAAATGLEKTSKTTPVKVEIEPVKSNTNVPSVGVSDIIPQQTKDLHMFLATSATSAINSAAKGISQLLDQMAIVSNSKLSEPIMRVAAMIAPSEPTIRSVAPTVAETDSNAVRKTTPRKVGSTGQGGGKVTQLFREGFAKMFEAAAIIDDLVDDNAEVEFTRPGREGGRVVKGS